MLLSVQLGVRVLRGYARSAMCPLLVADDTGGTIWRISYKGPPSEHPASPGERPDQKRKPRRAGAELTGLRVDRRESGGAVAARAESRPAVVHASIALRDRRIRGRSILYRRLKAGLGGMR